MSLKPDDATDATEDPTPSARVLPMHPEALDDAAATQSSTGAPTPPIGWRADRGAGEAPVDEAGDGAWKPYYASLLAGLEQKCREIIEAAHSDAEEIRRSAEQYRAAVVSEAHRASEAIRAAAERERDGVLRAASAEITYWLDEFEQECRRWVAQSHQSAAESEPETEGGTGQATSPR